MDTHGAVKAHRGCEASSHASETHPPQASMIEPVHMEPLLEVNSRVTMLQFNQLLQQCIHRNHLHIRSSQYSKTFSVTETPSTIALLA